ncbi:phosphotransferase family protein [soil metagenome]
MSGAVQAERGIVPPVRAVSLASDETRARLTGWFARRFDDPDFAITAMAAPGSAGINNETLILSVASSAPELADVAGLVVRLETPNSIFPALDIALHYRIYATMQDEPLAPTPRMFGFEEDSAIVGRRFFVMEKLEGLIPSDNPPFHQSGWVADMTEEDRAALWTDAIRTMARLQQVPTDRFQFLKDAGLGTAQQQMTYLRRYYEDARGPKDYPLMEVAWDWLQANFPKNPVEGFAWGDARSTNMLFQGTRCVGVLDWDQISLAGAEIDLGWWLLHDWVGSFGGARLSGLHGPAETVRIWEEAIGRPARDMEFWLILNLFRLGGIMIRLKAFLIANGTPAEAVADMDWRNAAQSILQSRFGIGEPLGMGDWAVLSPALS